LLSDEIRTAPRYKTARPEEQRFPKHRGEPCLQLRILRPPSWISLCPDSLHEEVLLDHSARAQSVCAVHSRWHRFAIINDHTLISLYYITANKSAYCLRLCVKLLLLTSSPFPLASKALLGGESSWQRIFIFSHSLHSTLVWMYSLSCRDIYIYIYIYAHSHAAR